MRIPTALRPGISQWLGRSLSLVMEHHTLIKGKVKLRQVWDEYIASKTWMRQRLACQLGMTGTDVT